MVPTLLSVCGAEGLLAWLDSAGHEGGVGRGYQHRVLVLGRGGLGGGLPKPGGLQRGGQPGGLIQFFFFN